MTPNSTNASVDNDKLMGLFQFLSGRKAIWTWITLIVTSVLGLAYILLVAYLCWGLGVVFLFNWGLSSPTFWKIVVALIGIMYALVIPVVVPYWIYPFYDNLLRILAEQNLKRTRRKLEAYSDKSRSLQEGYFARSERGDLEEDVLARDKYGLLAIIIYSRDKLDKYYELAVNQTDTSFRFSIIAMWLGFAVILIGILPQVLPIQVLRTAGSQNIETIALAGGIVIEIISALFLWVYKSSLRQLTYFYNRQMYNYNILLCSNMIHEIPGEQDIRRLIVEKVLDKEWIKESANPPHYRHWLRMPMGSPKR